MFKKKKLVIHVVAYAFNPRTWKVEVGLDYKEHPGLHKKTLSQNNEQTNKQTKPKQTIHQ